VKTMRILVAHKYMFYGGGTATYIFALWKELEKRGHEVIPFTVAYEQTVPTKYREFFVSPPAGNSQTHLRDIRMSPWTAIKLFGRATWSIEAYRKALALVDAAKPDIAYVHNLYSYMSPSPIAAFKKRGIPVVMRVPDMNMVCPGLRAIREGRACLECMERGLLWSLRFRCHKGSLLGTLARVITMKIHRLARVYELVDAFVTPSLFMKEVLVRSGIPAERIEHIPSFYRPETVPVNHAAQPEKPYILYVGRISPEKGVEVLVRAAKWIPNHIDILIAGGSVDGEKERLESLARRLDVTHVRFLGFQNREAVNRLMSNCLFTVMPSRCYDNAPMAVLESFAHEKPVVGANIGGIAEQIGDSCGLLFEPGNPRDLAQKITYLLEHRDEREAMGRAARERLEKVYSPDVHCERLLELFRAVAQGVKIGESHVSVAAN